MNIIDEFFPLRLRLYEKRRAAQLAQLEFDASISRNKIKFIEDVTSGRLKLFESSSNGGSGAIPREVITQNMISRGFEAEDTLVAKREAALGKILGESYTSSVNSVVSKRPFDYLLDMAIQSLSAERRDALLQQTEKIDGKWQQVKQQSAQDLWVQELDVLQEALDRNYREDSIKY